MSTKDGISDIVNNGYEYLKTKFDVDARKENVGKYKITLGIYPSRED